MNYYKLYARVFYLSTKQPHKEEHSLRSRRELVPARTSVPNANAKTALVARRMGRSLVSLPASPLAKIPSRSKPARELAASPQKGSRAHPLPPATQAKKSKHLYACYV